MLIANYLFQGSSTIANIAELFGLLIVFIVILVLAYYTSRWVGKNGVGLATKNRNITVVETMKLSASKYVQIVKITDKYFAIAVSKDSVEFLSEIDGDKIEKIENQTQPPSFKDILSKVKHTTNEHSENKKNEKKDKNDV